jgi:preprotein translocase SecE subunit
MLEYLKGVRQEAAKIVFPEKEEVRKNTLIVLAICTVSALGMWGVSTLVIEGLKVIM